MASAPRTSDVVPSKSMLGRVLGPPSPDSDWWDRQKFGSPIVIPGRRRDPDQGNDGPIPAIKWRMYYYGRSSDDVWGQGVKAVSTPFGVTGLATSDDGVFWERFRGPLEGGALFLPSQDPSAFDNVHVNVADVIPPWQTPDGLWWMYYFAGGLGGLYVKGQVPRGAFPMSTGLAKSKDGVSFQRHGTPVVDTGAPGSLDQYCAAFARVLPPAEAWPAGQPHHGNWYLNYHAWRGDISSTAPMKAVMCVALSKEGVAWEKKGGVLAEGVPGSWDEGGIGMRHVVQLRGTFYMLYTGFDSHLQFAIGLATSRDGLQWEKAEIPGKEPGGPVFTKSSTPAWDDDLVAAPYIVKQDDGSLLMYYMGATQEARGEGPVDHYFAIGLAVSTRGDMQTWTRFGE